MLAAKKAVHLVVSLAGARAAQMVGHWAEPKVALWAGPKVGNLVEHSVEPRVE